MLRCDGRGRPRRALAGCGLLLTVTAGCARPVDDPGAPLDSLRACPGAGSVIGVFVGTEPTADAGDGPTVQGVDAWALSVSGDVRRLTDDGLHTGAVIAPDARTVYQMRSSGRVLGESLESASLVETHDLTTGRVTRLVELGGIVDLGVSADGRWLAAAHTVEERPGTGDDVHSITVVDLASPGATRTLPRAPDADTGLFSAVTAVAPSPDGARMAYAQVIEIARGSVAHTLRIRDVATNADVVVHTADGTDFHADVEWSADGSTVVAAVRHQAVGDTVESPPRFRTVRHDVASGATTVREGYAQDVTPVAPDAGRLLGVVPAAGQGDPSRALVAWDRSGGPSRPLAIGRGAQGVSVATCSYR
ncbi:hypothetical protein FHU33_2349 [Blastococcus colisei]|uniref:WD40 repeat protein n=1 Tax=Blastococcus colisei TaxID=1564162 RepID=A0A543PFT1_9ACTN|nr:hypothetical protein [Blastococcus colisei]TQN42934.1 hypothetical protein FHU33_2349 [Blastococcus colisei]